MTKKDGENDEMSFLPPAGSQYIRSVRQAEIPAPAIYQPEF
jgi:hypothetical protein